MSTVRDRIKRAMRLIGVIASGETPPANELDDGLSAANGMLSSWSTENLIIPYVTREEFALVSGTQSYTMGSGGTFNTTRPLEIVKAGIEDGDIELPLNIIEVEEWACISLKSTESSIPCELYVEYGHLLATLRFWPIPSEVKNIVLYSEKPLTAFASVNTTVELAPGYEDAIDYNLAIRLAPEYGKTVPAEVAAIASETKANIKRRNSRKRLLRVDPALNANGRRFNILTGE